MASKRKESRPSKPGIAPAPLTGGAEAFRKREIQKHTEQRLRLISKNIRENLLRISGPIPGTVWDDMVKDVLSVAQWLAIKETEEMEASKPPEDKPRIIIP